MEKKSNKTMVIIILIVLGTAVGLLVYSNTRPGQYDNLARCLEEKGAIFWGAFWCPHCQNQKKQFGNSERLLPYIECSLPNGKGQTQECNDAGIQGYPTWQFPDGERIARVMAPEELAEKAGCEL